MPAGRPDARRSDDFYLSSAGAAPSRCRGGGSSTQGVGVGALTRGASILGRVGRGRATSSRAPPVTAGAGRAPARRASSATAAGAGGASSLACAVDGSAGCTSRATPGRLVLATFDAAAAGSWPTGSGRCTDGAPRAGVAGGRRVGVGDAGSAASTGCAVPPVSMASCGAAGSVASSGGVNRS